jgi:hypothetical protein
MLSVVDSFRHSLKEEDTYIEGDWDDGSNENICP